MEVQMKSKLKLGLIVASALIFSASFGYIVRQMIKGREAESAFQSLSEQISETEPETTPAETSMPESLVSEETLVFLSSEEEEHLLIPVIKKPGKAVNKTLPEPIEESESSAPEETSADSPSVVVMETMPAVPVQTSESLEPTRETVTTQPSLPSPYYKGIRNCVGWLRIDGTAVNYPVMQSKDEPEFYLHHAVSGEYSYPGVPFLDARCGIGVSNQLIIYGHNMKNGTMFHDLRYYASRDYWQCHRYICLDTLSGSTRYEVMAVIQYDADHDPFRFNAYTEMDADIFAWFVRQVRARQLYETGVNASFGDAWHRFI